MCQCALIAFSCDHVVVKRCGVAPQAPVSNSNQGSANAVNGHVNGLPNGLPSGLPNGRPNGLPNSLSNGVTHGNGSNSGPAGVDGGPVGGVGGETHGGFVAAAAVGETGAGRVRGEPGRPLPPPPRVFFCSGVPTRPVVSMSVCPTCFFA